MLRARQEDKTHCFPNTAIRAWAVKISMSVNWTVSLGHGSVKKHKTEHKGPVWCAPRPTIWSEGGDLLPRAWWENLCTQWIVNRATRTAEAVFVGCCQQSHNITHRRCWKLFLEKPEVLNTFCIWKCSWGKTNLIKSWKKWWENKSISQKVLFYICLSQHG